MHRLAVCQNAPAELSLPPSRKLAICTPCPFWQTLAGRVVIYFLFDNTFVALVGLVEELGPTHRHRASRGRWRTFSQSGVDPTAKFLTVSICI